MMNTARSGFDRTLEAIEAKIIELFGMVAEDLPAVTQAFLDGRGDMATALAQREQFVDALYRQVEELAGRELLLQAPVASDLRFLRLYCGSRPNSSAPMTWSCSSPPTSGLPSPRT